MNDQCLTAAGSDQCVLREGHEGDHKTYWGGGVVMLWRGNESWSHRVWAALA